MGQDFLGLYLSESSYAKAKWLLHRPRRIYPQSGKTSHITIMSVLVTQRCPVLLSVHETSWHDRCPYHWPQLPPKWQPHTECYWEWSQVCSNADLSPVIWLSQTNTMAWIIQRCCVIGRCVSLPGNIPCTTLSVSLDMVND